MFDKQCGNAFQDVIGFQLSIDLDGHTSPGKFVDHGQHAEGPTVMGSVHDEVVGPDVVWPTRAKTDAGSIIEPEPTTFRLFLRDFQPLPSPNALHPFGIDVPSFRTKQRGDTPIAIATIMGRQTDGRRRESIFVRTTDRNLALGGSVLTHRLAGPALRNSQNVLKMINTASTTGGA